jgi:hypothetical protein
MSDRINEQVKQNAASIQAIIDNAKDLNELATITGNPVSADLFLLRIASTGQSVSITYAELLSLFNTVGATSFINLTDTPANYTLKQGQNVKVNTSGNGLEFTPDYKDFELSAENTAVQTGTSYSLICNRPFKFVNEFVFSVNTAPTGSSIIIDVRKNGTSIMTQLANIEAGEKSTSTSATPGAVDKPVNFNIGDSLAFRVTQVGSSLPGAGMRCTMTYNVPYVV